MAISQGQMSVSGHFKELRNRVIRSFAVLMIFFMVSFNYSEKVIAWIKTRVVVDEKTALIFLSPGEALWANVLSAVFVAIVVAFPYVAFEIWSFIAPGMKKNEKRFSIFFIVASTMFFYSGLAFAIILVLPFSIGFLLQYKTEGLTPLLSIGKLLDFYLKFAISFAAIFEIPLILMILAKMGLVTTDFLARNRKYALLVSFIVAAILTPTTDIFNQLFMAVPMIILYEIGIIFTRIF